MFRKLLLALLGLVICLLVFQSYLGCYSTPTLGNKDLPTVEMTLGNEAFTLEVANTDRTRETGLMYRDSMSSNHGMIFVFQDAQERGFWMKHTHIPLDIVYIDAQQKIVSIRTMRPYDTRTVPSDGEAQWAIELNAGTAARLGLKPGQELSIPPGALSAKE